MLDENLPTFFLRNAPDGIKHHASYSFTQRGSEPEPTYALHRLDPALPDSQNCYSVALLDPYTPEVPYAEVLVRPDWTSPTLSQEAIRKNGGIPPPPQPLLPAEFTIQLYSPDQQVLVKYKQSTWGGSPSWEFEMPQTTFRQPSSSQLDRSLSDPTMAPTTPRIKFTWRKEKLSKEMVCTMSGKMTNPNAKPKKSKEPDITIAMFESLKALSIYEPNLHRVDMEDFKGLEIVILFSAAVIKDIYFGNFRQVFNINTLSSPSRRASVPPQSRPGSFGPSPSLPTIHEPSSSSSQPVFSGARPRPEIGAPSQSAPPGMQQPYAMNTPGNINNNTNIRRHSSGILSQSNNDPRRQWEIEVESARLREQMDVQARERRRAELAGERLAKKISKVELKEENRRRAEIDRETERLRRLYLVDQRPFAGQGSLGHTHSAPQIQVPFTGPSSARPSVPGPSIPMRRPVPHPAQSPPSQAYPMTPASYSAFHNGRPTANAGGLLTPPAATNSEQRILGQKKRSFFGLRSHSDSSAGGKKLMKKQSSLF